MTDHKKLAEQYIGSVTPDTDSAVPYAAVANVHATLHLAEVLSEVIEALAPPHDMIHAAAVSYDPLIQEDPDVTQRVIQQVYDRRLSQIAQGWTAEHDMEHGPDHLKDLAWQYLWGDIAPMKTDRERFEIAAALLCSALEVMARRNH